MATLQRVASRWQIVALAINDVVGSGVNLLPAAAAALLGPASLWAVAVAGVAVLAVVLCFAEASSHFDQPGSAYLFALAREGFGPRFLASVHPRFRTPAAAILTQTAIALPLALSGSFVGLATLSVVARLVTYLATTTAVPVLRRRHAAAGSFRLPGGLAIPAVATMVSLGLLVNASWINLAAAAAAALVGGVIYLLRRTVD